MSTFESSVILQGSKTTDIMGGLFNRFESSVILQGSKTDKQRGDQP